MEKKNISDWPKSGPVETGPTGPVATPLQLALLSNMDLCLRQAFIFDILLIVLMVVLICVQVSLQC